MPIARIRSFDPEAIAFLAAQLAQSGYTLQFVRPDETGLEVADLELTVVRRDLHEALRTAEDEAERLGVDITVMPGAIPTPEPILSMSPVAPAVESFSPAADISEPTAPFPGGLEVPDASQSPVIAARQANRDVPKEKPRWVQVTQDSSEKTAHLFGRGLGKAIDGFEVISDSVERGVAKCKDDLSEIGDSTASRLHDWKTRLHATQANREIPQPEGFLPPHAGARNFRRPKPLWLRERIYRGAAVAAVLAVAALIGWTLAGYAGPANPVGKGTGLSTVQEQVPFGPASASAPAAIVPARLSQNEKPKSAVAPPASHARPARHDDDQEVVVRHFDQKPASVQAKTKNRDTVTRDGVKIISEE